MKSGFLKQEFESARGLLYLFATTPLAILVSHPLPGLFLPVVTSAAAFPLFFFHIRKGALKEAYWNMAAWALMQFTIVAWIASIDPGYVSGMLYEASLREPLEYTFSQKLLLELATDRARETAMSGGLSIISGGAMALAMFSYVVIASALEAGLILNQGAGIDAAILSVYPWNISRYAGSAMIATGLASVFYMWLEGKPLKPGNAIKWIIFGASLIFLDIYLYFEIGAAWTRAVSLAMVN